jgi:hypothetical protein
MQPFTEADDGVCGGVRILKSEMVGDPVVNVPIGGEVAKPKKGQEYLHLREVAEMASKLKDESDRAAALIVASWVDDALTEMVINHVLHDEKLIESMFGHMGPLGTFSSKIRLAYLTRMVSFMVYENLEIIRGIRNEFAHSRGDVQFSDQSITDRCRNLVLKRLKGDGRRRTSEGDFSPRKAYMATGLTLTGFLIEFRSAATMSPDGREDYFPRFMHQMANKMMKSLKLFMKPTLRSRDESPEGKP